MPRGLLLVALVASAALAAVESRATDSAEKKYAGTASPVCSSAEACTCEGVCSSIDLNTRYHNYNPKYSN